MSGSCVGIGFIPRVVEGRSRSQYEDVEAQISLALIHSSEVGLQFRKLISQMTQVGLLSIVKQITCPAMADVRHYIESEKELGG